MTKECKKIAIDILWAATIVFGILLWGFSADGVLTSASIEATNENAYSTCVAECSKLKE